MPVETLLKGIVLGFSIAAPVGPIGVLCIRRTLSEGRLAGLVSGLGAASADAIYGSIAAFGLTVIADFLVAGRLWLGLVGGLYLAYLGVRTWRTKPRLELAPVEGGSLGQAYFSTLLLTLTNPLTILSFAAIFAGLGAAGERLSGALLVAGVFLGSAGWWLLLSGGVGLLRRRLDERLLVWVNRVSGAVLVGFAAAILVGLFL